MPSILHEQVVELIHKDPSIAIELARNSKQVNLPPFDSFSLGDAELRQLVPPERHIDVVVLLSKDKVVFVILVEVQTSIDEEKKFTWPFYQTAIRLKHRCPVCLLVYAIGDDVLRWASSEIELGQPDSPFCPLVLSGEGIAKITKTREARKAPYRAILSMLMHAHEKHAEKQAVATLTALDKLPVDERAMWQEMIVMKLNHAAKKALEELMDVQSFKKVSVWFKEGKEEGKKRGLKAGLGPLKHLFERKLGRPLSSEESESLMAKLAILGPEPLGDAVLDFDAENLSDWLHTDVRRTSVTKKASKQK